MYYFDIEIYTTILVDISYHWASLYFRACW